MRHTPPDSWAEGGSLAPRGVGWALGLVGVELVCQPGHSICKLLTAIVVSRRGEIECCHCLLTFSVSILGFWIWFFRFWATWRIGVTPLSGDYFCVAVLELYHLALDAMPVRQSYGFWRAPHDSLSHTEARACAAGIYCLQIQLDYFGLIVYCSWKNCFACNWNYSLR